MSVIQTKCIFDLVAEDDGARVLVDRVWPRGLSKKKAALTFWLRDIAPTAELRRWFRHQPERWDEFRRRYYLELAHSSAAIERLDQLMAAGNVTLLFGAHDRRHNNAVALLDYLRRYRTGFECECWRQENLPTSANQVR